MRHACSAVVVIVDAIRIQPGIQQRFGRIRIVGIIGLQLQVQIDGAFEIAVIFQQTGGIPQSRRGERRGRVFLDERRQRVHRTIHIAARRLRVRLLDPRVAPARRLGMLIDDLGKRLQRRADVARAFIRQADVVMRVAMIVIRRDETLEGRDGRIVLFGVVIDQAALKFVDRHLRH